MALFVAAITPSFAQSNSDQILLASGIIINADVDTLDTLNLYYSITKKNGKVKYKSVELERVFSYTDEKGKEHVKYVADADYFTVDEMRDFIKGEQDALRVHKSNWVWLVVTPVSAVGTFALARTSVAAFAVPPASMILSLIPPYKIKQDQVDLTEVKYPDAYSMGYQKAAKGRRVIKATFAALLGGAVGLGALSATAE